MSQDSSDRSERDQPGPQEHWLREQVRAWAVTKVLDNVWRGGMILVVALATFAAAAVEGGMEYVEGGMEYVEGGMEYVAGGGDVGGGWAGEASRPDEGEFGLVSLDLDQDGDAVSGSGEIRAGEASGGALATFVIRGGSVRDDGTITLPAFADAGGVRQQLRLAGEVSGDEMDLTATGSEGEIPVNLRRQKG